MTVNVPAVIPGVADVQIRADSDDVRQVSTAVTRLAGAARSMLPSPTPRSARPIDPHLFTSSLWLMEYGSMRVLINVAGAHGPAQLSVPVPSAARRMLPMPPALGALLLTLAIALAIGAISIVGAAARESRLAPGDLSRLAQAPRMARDGDSRSRRRRDFLSRLCMVTPTRGVMRR